MIISCPSCSARFTVDDSALGAEGRKVKCSKCGHIWLQGPGVAAADIPDVELEPIAAMDRTVEVEIEAVAEVEPAQVRARPRRRRMAPIQEERRSSGAAMWLLLIVVVAVIAGGGYWYRDKIMETLPATRDLFAVIGIGPKSPYAGLDLIDVTWKQDEPADGAKILRITGKVLNKSGSPKDVPELSGILYDDQDQELYKWTFKAPEPGRLLPSEEVVFNTQVTNPNARASRLTIKFSEPAKPEKKPEN